MSRSIKKHMGHYSLVNVHSVAGKKITSRKLRKRVRVLLRKMGEDFDFHHKLDKTRGNKGSRDWGYGWEFFGDGYHLIWRYEDISYRFEELTPKEKEFYWRCVRK